MNTGKRIFLAIGACVLAGCAGTSADLAVDACVKEISGKTGGRVYSLDHDEMRANYKAQDNGIGEIAATITFDQGLPSQTQQAFTCRVQFGADASQPPSVIFLQFMW